MLTHRNIIAVSDGMMAGFPSMAEPGSYVSYLPLCHVAEQQMTNYVQMATGGEVTFLDDPTKLLDTLKVAQPTIFLGVPRVWEKIEAALSARLGQATGARKAMASWAMSSELRGFDQDVARNDGRVRVGLTRGLARRGVLQRVWAGLGLNRLKLAVTGGAPMPEQTMRFFASLGIVIYDGYGMSETAGVATAPTQGRPRFGTVGRALPGLELRIAEDGEVMLRGPSMTSGYYDRPQWTSELYDDEGWLFTGDLGRLDDEGNLVITGRKKEIIITAGRQEHRSERARGLHQAHRGNRPSHRDWRSTPVPRRSGHAGPRGARGGPTRGGGQR